MGTGTGAADAAQAADTARQQNIQAAIGQITQAYSSPQRQQQYTDFGKNLQNYYTGQVNEQEGTNARNLKFAMARNGLTGGSASVDANTQLQKDYTKGLLEASRQAQAGEANLQQSDVNAKNQMISLAQQGNYTGAIPQQVSEAQLASLGSAQSNLNPSALGNLFSNEAGLYSANQTAAANRRAQVTPIGSLYGGSSSAGVFG
jgi:hypothetical protein